MLETYTPEEAEAIEKIKSQSEDHRKAYERVEEYGHNWRGMSGRLMCPERIIPDISPYALSARYCAIKSFAYAMERPASPDAHHYRAIAQEAKKWADQHPGPHVLEMYNPTSGYLSVVDKDPSGLTLTTTTDYTKALILTWNDAQDVLAFLFMERVGMNSIPAPLWEIELDKIRAKRKSGAP